MQNTVAQSILGLLRIITGLFFAFHGAMKLFGAFGGTAVATGLWPYWYAGLIELFAGLALLVGFATRPAAVLASGTMAYAYFVVHQPMGLTPLQNGGELAAVYAWVFLYIAVAGPGRFAVDSILGLDARITKALPIDVRAVDEKSTTS